MLDSIQLASPRDKLVDLVPRNHDDALFVAHHKVPR